MKFVTMTQVYRTRSASIYLDSPLGLDGCDGRVYVLGDNIASVQHAAGHVFAMTGIALHHLVSRLETGVRDFGHRKLLMIRLLGRNYGSVCDQREVDTRIWHQVGLEFCQIDVQSTVETQGCGD